MTPVEFQEVIHNISNNTIIELNLRFQNLSIEQLKELDY